jgi:hypothetical protein
MGDTPPTKPPTARGRLGELFAKVDAFFDRAAARAPGPEGITCRAGCADCCRRFSVTALEAEVIVEGLASLPAEAREGLAARAIGGDPGVCPALEGDGRCAIYAFRPILCRTHGLPIRFASPLGQPGQPGRTARSLPLVDACPRNFAGRDLDSLPPDTILDQTTLSTMLGALDAAHAEETGRPRGVRREIAALVTGATKC